MKGSCLDRLFAILGRAAYLGESTVRLMKRRCIGALGWNDKVAITLLVICARHLLATELGPLTATRLTQFVTQYNFPQLITLFAQSPSPTVRHDARHIRRLSWVSQSVYQWVMSDIPDALSDPLFRANLVRAAYQMELDLFTPSSLKP